MKKRFEQDNIAFYQIESNENLAAGISIGIPNSDLKILQIRCKKGMLFCGIFHPEIIEKLEIPAGIFSAPTFADMLQNQPVFLSKAAQELGANPSMTGKELLHLFSAKNTDTV